jgi:7,8-dihydropterin-6-yl-methyl-4-(beta-D-ribofuranosyl)aminobenzene 5'-phosphate synthase
MAALGRLNGRRIPVFVHPDMFVWRGAREESGKVHFTPHTFVQKQLEDAGVDVILNTEACPIFDSALYVLGEIPRRTDFEAGVPNQVRRDGNEWVADPWVWDDRSLVFSVRGEGLVVVTGCAHAGLINTLLHAREVAGETRLRAVIGGFHLFGSRYEPHIPRVVNELRALEPDLLAPAHCTGKRGEIALVEALPAATVPSGALLRIRIPA